MTHHVAHHFGAFLAVGIGTFTAIAMAMWVVASADKAPDDSESRTHTKIPGGAIGRALDRTRRSARRAGRGPDSAA